MVVAEKERMVQSVNEYVDSSLERDLLLFWSWHPHTNFTARTIAHAVKFPTEVDIEEALECLVKDELLEKHICQGLDFYCLTADPEKRQWLLNLFRSVVKPWSN